ncbi:hypothetical protein [Aquabacterium sp.]|uniref:hypothetical protein n=1 Tax=Aquabacterium sp. TaxID=1872578 RepID=UPI00262E3EF1|nr:hypothetical protein [Aquabacterium sp.]MDD2978297.1 hypothetical protein [Aquabacterium sp.]
MTDIKASYRATRTSTHSRASIDTHLTLDLHQMIVWCLTHPEHARELLPSYMTLRERVEQDQPKLPTTKSGPLPFPTATLLGLHGCNSQHGSDRAGTEMLACRYRMRTTDPDCTGCEDRDEITPQTIADRLQQLAAQMLDTAVQMDYFGGFSLIGQHGKELAGAAVVAQSWADGIREDYPAEDESAPEQPTDRAALQAAGTHPAPCARHCESNAYQIEIRRISAERDALAARLAQQIPPLTPGDDKHHG